MKIVPIDKTNVRKRLQSIQKCALDRGLNYTILDDYDFVINFREILYTKLIKKILIISGFVALLLSITLRNNILSTRCLLPSNYLVWEVTRPITDCNYCINVTKPIILKNVTREMFSKYAYISRPVIVKNAINHWRATKEFSFSMFKDLYEHTSGSYESLYEGCQFLNFKTDLFTLEEVFAMPVERIRNEPGQTPWYVGWGNCHTDILAKVRRFYDIPNFLPEDAEYPATENIFFGYETGAVMHLDYIPRLMWQGQVRGNKIWYIAPVPECEHICNKFQYYVEQGDIVLMDTRVWYHATSIPKGQFSITVQSEYG